MKTYRDTWRKIRPVLRALGILALLICTIIGGYGILRAPGTDQEEMERELEKNARELKKASTSPRAFSSPTPALGELPSSSPQAFPTPEQKSAPKSLSVIADSVFLGAAPSFKKIYPQAEIDAKVSRQVRQGLDVAKKMKQKKKLGDIVILSLGTNGTFHPDTGQALIDYLGKERTIYWIDAYGKKLSIQQEVNQTIRKLVKKNSNVHLISWSQEAKKHPGWFYQDGTHLNLKGQEGFCRFLRKELKDL